MQAYKYTTLYNKQVQEQSSQAFVQGCFTEETYKKIVQAHPVTLYTPNYFIRIALGLLTTIILIFVAVILGLLMDTSSEDALIGLFIFMSIVCYLALEVFVNQRYYYNAGIDNVLTAGVIVCVLSAICIQGYFSALAISEVMVLVCGWLCIRFADAFMALLFYVSLYAFVFLFYVELDSIAKATAPFVMLIFSAGVFVLTGRLRSKEKIRLYYSCCEAVRYVSIVSAYLSVNYMIVKEVSNEMFNLHLSLHDTIPLGWLFWILTVVFPLAVAGYGMRKKRPGFMIIGLLMGVATCCTIRYYHAVLPYEIALILSGSVLLLSGYLLIRHLKIPRYGFVASADSGSDRKKLLAAEAALLVQLFGKAHASPAENNTSSGGGSSGGGGASGNY
jgi:hypothetical protein